MKLIRLAAAAFSLALAAASVAAQPGPNLSQQLATLTDQPGRHAGFTFDRNMLSVAQNVLEANGMDARHAAVALTAITFDQYHFQQPAFYIPEANAALLESYRAAGWKHLVDGSKAGNQTPQNAAQPRSMATDLWLHFAGSDIDAVTVLMRGPRDMQVVQITGDLRPLDLLRLSGHFGIPKVDPGAVMVPDNQAPPPR